MEQKDVLRGHKIEVSEIKESDIPQMRPILEAHVRDRNTHEILWGEIFDIESYMRGGEDRDKRTRRYLVARDETGKVWGCMAYSAPDSDMVRHFNIADPDRTAELLNAFVSPEVFRGGGLGKKIFEAICEDTKARGKDLLVIHSGPRYKLSWGFYDKMCGENQGMIVEKYGKDGDAMTWEKPL